MLPASDSNLEKVSVEYQLIYGDPVDVRGPMQLDESDPLAENAVEEFLARQVDELSKANAVAYEWAPNLHEILGLQDLDQPSLAKNAGSAWDWNEEIGTGAVAEKHNEVHFEKRASSPHKIRLEKTVIDGETWVFGYDHNGEVVHTHLFEDTAA